MHLPEVYRASPLESGSGAHASLAALRDADGRDLLVHAVEGGSVRVVDYLVGSAHPLPVRSLSAPCPRAPARQEAVLPLQSVAEGACCAASGLGFAVSRPFGPHGRTPLAAAAYAGQGDMLRHLVTMGAKLEGPDASNLLNEGPLWDAVRGGGANLSEGGTASILRSIVGTREVNIRNTKGDTLLHWAAANGACDAIRWLAESGADLIAPNANGKVPREVATAHGQMEAELLLSRLARGQVVLPNAADWMSRRRK